MRGRERGREREGERKREEKSVAKRRFLRASKVLSRGTKVFPRVEGFIEGHEGFSAGFSVVITDSESYSVN